MPDETATDTDTAVRALLREHPLIDGHNDLAWRATLADVADHLEHLRAVAGVDHIGIGGDFDGTDELPTGLEDVSCYPRLLAELKHRGWPDADIVKLASTNPLRVLADNERIAQGENAQ